MSQQAPYIVYNASAGSGKTFTLVKEYIKVLLQNKDNFHFKKVLAITFTNKAAMEMKERVIANLQYFAKKENSDMMEQIMDETDLDSIFIQNKASAILKAVLEDYTAFGITTIDSFTHRIIRSFAYDFGMSQDFNVELDTQKVLSEAVDVVISQIGITTDLTQVLIDFSHQKSAEDSPWDISDTLFQFSKILLNESDSIAFQTIADRSLNDYVSLQKTIDKEYTILSKRMRKIGEMGLLAIENEGIDPTDFYSSMLPKHFLKLSKKWNLPKFFDQSVLRQRIEEKKFYTQSKSNEIKALIEGILPNLLELYYESEKLFSKLVLLNFFRNSIVPLSTLSFLYNALEQIKSDENIHLIVEFNRLIHEKIKNEPTPFIYERLGEKYQHFFIDEMQDTSVLQWENLSKLIDNVLSQEGGGLMLVGDAKQAIYRWRGGKSEQFIRLSDPMDTTPFHIQKKVANLKTNYRSFSEIIRFNNSFFQHIASLMHNEKHKNLYVEGNDQEENDKKGGYVQIEFITKDEEIDPILLFPKKVLESIENLDDSYSWKDVCVLVRRHKDAVAVASFLSENNIDIISSESLLLAINEKVDFLINLLSILFRTSDKDRRINLLNFLYRHSKTKLDQHQFYQRLVYLDEQDFFIELQDYNFHFSPILFRRKSLYDALEYGIRAFQLTQTSHAYLQYFLDVVLEFQTKNGSSLQGFLEFWEQQKEKLSISAPEGGNAIRIMTIHKAKGLQFPVVIFPYDLNIYQQVNPKIWYTIHEREKYNDFSTLLIPYTKDLQYMDEEGNDIYNKRRETLELDNYNLLYVALTRAVEQLYIITSHRIDKKNKENTDYFSGLFIHYLKKFKDWQPDNLQYSFGNKKRVSTANDSLEKTTSIETLVARDFISSDIENHQIVLSTKSSLLWDTEQGDAITYGNLIHEILAHIKTEDDISQVVLQYKNKGIINEIELESIQEKIITIVTHPRLKAYFQQNITVFNEREIVVVGGKSIIPDRLVIFLDKKAALIDYKTGVKDKKHEQQVNNYAKIIATLGFDIVEKLLVYIGDTISIEILE